MERECWAWSGIVGHGAGVLGILRLARYPQQFTGTEKSTKEISGMCWLVASDVAGIMVIVVIYRGKWS
jgi:hypothetical protein